MIAVDTSALMAVVLEELQADACAEALKHSGQLLISAATFAECLIVSDRRGLSDTMRLLLQGLDLTIEPVRDGDARRAAQAYSLWGKGIHPAGLNFCDCFAYALAKQRDCPLLYVGNDFSQTDVQGVDLAGKP